MLPLTVTATLAHGIVLDTLFGTALDGLLASTIRDRAKAAAPDGPLPGSLYDGGLHTPIPATVDLPLARCGHPDHDLDWHWMATTAHPHHPSAVDVRHRHTRIRERTIEATSRDLPATLPPASGRYRHKRMPVVATPTPRVTWQAVGNPDTITDLLTDLTAIGKHRNTGEGTVQNWTVTTHPDADPWTHGHLHPDDSLGRPTPLRCLTHRLPRVAAPADRTTVAGIRPPYWHPHTQHPVIIPTPWHEHP